MNRGLLLLEKSPASIEKFCFDLQGFFLISPGLRKFFEQNFFNSKKVIFWNNFQARSAKLKGGSGGNSVKAHAGVGRRPTAPL